MVLLVSLGCAPGASDDELLAPEEPAHSSPSAEADEPEDAQEPNVSARSGPAALPAAVTAWWPEISAASARHGLPPELVGVVVWLESNGDPDARSPAGALGLMQLMPGTAAKVAKARGEPVPGEDDLLDPERNLELGCAHLSELATGLGAATLDGAAVHRIAIAYNGGAQVLAAWEGGQPLPEETERYAAMVRERWEALMRAE